MQLFEGCAAIFRRRFSGRRLDCFANQHRRQQRRP